jgi:hypothetical protein
MDGYAGWMVTPGTPVQVFFPLLLVTPAQDENATMVF